MPRDVTPTTLWRESLRLWMRVWQMNADMALAWWKAAGLLPPPSIDPDVQKICEQAAHPCALPDAAPDTGANTGAEPDRPRRAARAASAGRAPRPRATRAAPAA